MNFKKLVEVTDMIVNMVAVVISAYVTLRILRVFDLDINLYIGEFVAIWMLVILIGYVPVRMFLCSILRPVVRNLKVIMN